MKKQFTFKRSYIIGAWIILLAVGIVKVFDSNSGIAALNSPDPVFGIKQGYVLFIVGYIEIILCCLMLFTQDSITRLSIIAWISSMFMIYRISLYLLAAPKGCPCIGHTLGKIFPYVGDNQSEISLVLFLYLFMGSYYFLVRELYSTKRNQNIDNIKIT